MGNTKLYYKIRRSHLAFLTFCRSTILLHALLLFGTIVFEFSSCNKSDLDSLPDFNLLKVYNDTLANGQNGVVGISAGQGRLFMVYGDNSLFDYSGQYQNLKSRLMATDNKGTFLWSNHLPEAMTQCVPIALDDGGCLVATQHGFGSNPDYISTSIYLFRYDKNGNLTRTDSVSLAPQFATGPGNVVFYLNAIKTKDGRIIIYGDSGYHVWMMEYSPDYGLVWLKGYEINFKGTTSEYPYLSGCIPTPDNGLLFTGHFDDYSGNLLSAPLLIKTNAHCDTLWTKIFSLEECYVWAANIIAAPNNNFRICFSREFQSIVKSTMYIYEINGNGDSITSVTVNNEDLNVGTVILETSDGGCFGLINKTNSNWMYTPSSLELFRQSNTRKAKFDAELNKTDDGPFQSLTTDFLPLACRTSDGDIACFGIQQPVGKTYYLPHLYFMKLK